MIHYRDVLDENIIDPDFEGGNQLEMQEKISKAVGGIMGTDSLFLHGGVDDQVLFYSKFKKKIDNIKFSTRAIPTISAIHVSKLCAWSFSILVKTV